MGMFLGSFILGCSVFMVFWAWKVFLWIWLQPMKMEMYLREKGIGGPHYRLLHGNLKELIRSTREAQSRPMELSHRIVPRVLPFHDQMARSNGKMFTTWYGPNLRLNIIDPELIKDIFMNKAGCFVKMVPPTNLLITGVVNYEGEKWAKHRRIINPAFHIEKLKMMSPAFYTSCNNMIIKWQKWVSETSCELDVWPNLQSLTKDVISRTAFGSCFEEGRRIFELTDELANLVFPVSVSVNIPVFRLLPTKRNKRMKKIASDIRKLLKDMICRRLEAIKLGASSNDLLGYLIESNFKETDDNTNTNSPAMSIDDIIDECKLFYFAGQETTSNLLVWTMIVLSMHCDWQAKAREEVMQVFGKRKPDFEGLNRLKTMTMILYEVLRLYPPTAFMLRATDREVQLGDVSLPAGVQIALPALLIHHSNEIWGEDAGEFKPERFRGGVSEATNNKVSFFPFGYGPRICLGQNFVFTEAKMALSMILQHFSFELSASYVHAPRSIITLQPQHGAQLSLHGL